MTPYSIYLHFPFCQRRCNYCDFNTSAGKQAFISSYLQALCIEITKTTANTEKRLPVHSVYFGGGTPSLAPLSLLEKVMDVIRREFELNDTLECSLEANPGTLSLDYISGLRSLGFNRLSLGMQSANESELKLLGRIHSYQDVGIAVEWARKAGFTNINLDLIYGIPGQTREKWQKNIQKALHFSPEHLSLYALTLEPHVLLARWIEKGHYRLPDDDEIADMYESADEILAENGFQQYEISNWAKSDPTQGLLTCRHNLQYWRNLPYFGFGSGAHAALEELRLENVTQLTAYIRCCKERDVHRFPYSPATKSTIYVNKWREMQETMMLGLRLIREGISRQAFLNRFGVSVDAVFANELSQLYQKELIHTDKDDVDIIRLSNNGRFVSNQVFMHFVD